MFYFSTKKREIKEKWRNGKNPTKKSRGEGDLHTGDACVFCTCTTGMGCAHRGCLCILHMHNRHGMCAQCACPVHMHITGSDPTCILSHIGGPFAHHLTRKQVLHTVRTLSTQQAYADSPCALGMLVSLLQLITILNFKGSIEIPSPKTTWSRMKTRSNQKEHLFSFT